MKRILTAIVLVVCSPCAWAASKASDIKQGNLLYNQQKYTQALEKYNSALDKAPDSSIINFDTGTAWYKKGGYDKAISHFEKSLLSDDPQLQFKGHYNLGNSMYKSGIQKEKTDLSAAIQSLQQSLSHYKKFLVLDPQDEDAKFNEAFVKKELERLEKKKEEYRSQPTDASREDEQDQRKTSQDQVDQRQPSEEKKDDSTRVSQAGQSSNDQEKKEPGKLSREEAKMLLENYSQNEEPKGLLNLRLQKQGTVAPVLKDW